MITPKSYKPQQEMDFPMVGSNRYGRYAKMSSEETFNMIEADEWLVPTPGYKRKRTIPGKDNKGRAIYESTRGNFRIAVIGNTVYRITGTNQYLTEQELFDIDTFTTDVFIDENNGYQIAVCDQSSLWIYDWRANTVNKAVLPINTQTGVEITPGYVAFHDGYFIVPDLTSSFWYLSAQNNGLNWFWGASSQPVAGSIQTKPEFAKAVVRVPGGGNLIYVFGKTVTEPWYNNGDQNFPYKRNNSLSIDYGCLSSSTIATMDNFVAWLGINEKSGPAIMVSTGSNATKISNDGIDFQLGRLKAPEKSVAFFYRQNGMVFYQLTFFDPKDNLSLIYNFNKESFYTVTDENMNYHIGQRVAFANNTYYMTSLNDPSIYELSTDYTNYDYSDPSNASNKIDDRYIKEIPRVRVLSPMNLIDTSKFSISSVNFIIESGNDPYYKGSYQRYWTTTRGQVITTTAKTNYIGKTITTQSGINQYIPRVDMTMSKDGGENFGPVTSKFLNPLGQRVNRMNYYQMGICNDLTMQFRFWSKHRVVVGSGNMQIRHSDTSAGIR